MGGGSSDWLLVWSVAVQHVAALRKTKATMQCYSLPGMLPTLSEFSAYARIYGVLLKN